MLHIFVLLFSMSASQQISTGLCQSSPKVVASLTSPSVLEEQFPSQNGAQLLGLHFAWRQTSDYAPDLQRTQGVSATASSSLPDLSYQNTCHFIFNAEVTLEYKILFLDILKNLTTYTHLIPKFVRIGSLWRIKFLSDRAPLQRVISWNIFPIQGQVLLSWSDCLLDWFSLIRGKSCDSTWSSPTVLDITIMGHFRNTVDCNTVQLVNMSQIRDASIPSISMYLSSQLLLPLSSFSHACNSSPSRQKYRSVSCQWKKTNIEGLWDHLAFFHLLKPRDSLDFDRNFTDRLLPQVCQHVFSLHREIKLSFQILMNWFHLICFLGQQKMTKIFPEWQL